MIAIFTLLITVTISLLVTRIGAVALMLTGLSTEVARFQARSAFTGVGFTTNESESIVNHPVRRKVLMMLMLMGNLGIAAVIATTIATFAIPPASQGSQWWIAGAWAARFAVLIIGLTLMWFIFTSRWIDDAISRIIEWALLKWTRLDVRDYVSLLHLSRGYVVMELQVSSDDWVTDNDLANCRLSDEGVLVLGLHRQNGQYIGSPNGSTVVRDGDVLTLYGPISRLEELDIRKKGYHGDRAHRIAVKAQQEIAADEQRSDPESPDPGKSG